MQTRMPRVEQQLGQRSDAAAEQCVRARAVSDRDVVARRAARSPRRRPGRSGLRRGAANQQPFPGECANRRSSRAAETRYSASACQGPVPSRSHCGLRVALGEMSRERKPELHTGARRARASRCTARAGRRRAGRCRRAPARSAPRCSANRRVELARRPCRTPRGRRSPRRPSSAQAVAAAPLKLQSPTVVIPERRHSSGAEPCDCLHVVEPEVALALDVEAEPRREVESPSPKPA